MKITHAFIVQLLISERAQNNEVFIRARVTQMKVLGCELTSNKSEMKEARKRNRKKDKEKQQKYQRRNKKNLTKKTKNRSSSMKKNECEIRMFKKLITKGAHKKGWIANANNEFRMFNTKNGTYAFKIRLSCFCRCFSIPFFICSL